MQIRAKEFNPQIFLEILCYFTFAALVLYLLGSGKYLSYITPRMKPYLIFSAAVMGIWGLATAGRLFRPQYKVRSMHCFVLAIPVLLILLPHNPLGISDISGGYVGGNILSGQTNQYGSSQRQTPPENSNQNAATGNPTDNPTQKNAKPAESSSASIGSELPPEDTSSIDSITPAAQSGVSDAYDSNDTIETPDNIYDFVDFPGLDEANKTITVSNDDFGMWLYEIYVNISKYEGYKVIMTGFIYKDSEFLEEDEFIPARLAMSCCVADLVPAGLICKYDGASELEKDSWVTVEGTLFIEEYKYDDMSFDEPQIHVTKITPADAVAEYVYPYY